MAFEDWDVVVTSVVAVPNTQKNPYTGKPIDPDGLTMSRFEMTLTHRSTGKVLERSDLHSALTRDALKQYARNVIEVAEIGMATQSDASIIGVLDVVPPARTDTRTEAEKDVEAFRQIDSQLSAQIVLMDALKVASPKDAAALDAKLADLIVVRDAAAKKAAESVVVAVSAVVEGAVL